MKGLQILMVAVAVCSQARAADAPKSPPRSADDRLRDTLDSKSGDDYDRALLGDIAKPAGKDRSADDLQKKLRRELGPAAQREDESKTVLQVAKDMDEAHKRLAAGKSDAITQHMQRQIVSDLEGIIDEAKKSGKTGGRMQQSSTSKPSGQPNAKSTSKPEASSRAAGEPPASKSDPNARHEPKQASNERDPRAHKGVDDPYTVELQAHQREQMLELPSEDFLPEYKLEIEDYFRRMSENKPELEGP